MPKPAIASSTKANVASSLRSCTKPLSSASVEALATANPIQSSPGLPESACTPPGADVGT